MNEIIGLESLEQRGKTPFFKELIALYQESFDDIAKLKIIDGGTVVLTLKALNFKDRMKKIFLTHMGIPLRCVTVEDTVDPNLICWLYMDSPVYLKNTREKSKSSGMMMDMINQFYNDKTGRYDRDEPLAQTYHFGLSVFTALWIMRNKDGSFYLTPEELAAATLHEAGHIDHFIRASKRLYADTLDASEIVTYLQQSPDKEIILALLEAIRQSKRLDKSWNDIVKSTDHYFRTSNSLDSKEYHEALATLCALVTAEIADVNVKQLNADFHLLGPGDRVVGTRLIDVDIERSADEFAARNGAYSALNAVTSKLSNLTTSRQDILLRQFMWAPPAALFSYLNYFLSLFDVGAEDIANGYDPIIRRMELVIETAKHAFSNLTLSDEIKTEIHQQIVVSEHYLQQYKSTNHQMIRSRLKQWKDSVGKFGRIFASPIQHRLSQDYERLQDSTRSLSRNSLYYLANK